MTKRNNLPVLAFNKHRKFIGLFNSVNSAAKMLDVQHTSVRAACIGVAVSCRHHYFRYLFPNIEIVQEDFGKMTVDEYDGLCGVNRRTYSCKGLSKVKFKVRKTEKNTFDNLNVNIQSQTINAV